jgi:hypothetical protein
MVQLPHKVKGNMRKSWPQYGLGQAGSEQASWYQTGFSISMNRCSIENRSAR